MILYSTARPFDVALCVITNEACPVARCAYSPHAYTTLRIAGKRIARILFVAAHASTFMLYVQYMFAA